MTKSKGVKQLYKGSDRVLIKNMLAKGHTWNQVAAALGRSSMSIRAFAARNGIKGPYAMTGGKVRVVPYKHPDSVRSKIVMGLRRSHTESMRLKEEVARMLWAGATVQEIATTQGISTKRVYTRLRKQGIAIKELRLMVYWTALRREYYIEAIREGHSHADAVLLSLKRERNNGRIDSPAAA